MIHIVPVLLEANFTQKATSMKNYLELAKAQFDEDLETKIQIIVKAITETMEKLGDKIEEGFKIHAVESRFDCAVWMNDISLTLTNCSWKSLHQCRGTS